MSFTQDFFTSRDNYSDSETKIGQAGRLWYDSETNTIRISDGRTPGGFVVGQGNGSAYILPTASLDKLGGVRVDGVQFEVDQDGYLSYNLPVASTNTLGAVKVDGYTIVVDENTGTIRATGAGGPAYTLPIAETGVDGILGGVKIGRGLHINSDTGLLEAAIPQASLTTSGLVKVDGYTIIINESTGVISATGNFTGGNISNPGDGGGLVSLPIAGYEPNGPLGGVIIGDGLSINPFTGVVSLNLPKASSTSLGGVKVDGQTVVINEETGVISALAGATVSLLDAGTLDVNNVYTNKVTGIRKLGFDTESGFDVIDLGNGLAKIAMNSTFKFWRINNFPGLVAEGLDTVNFIAGNGISITANNNTTPKQIMFSFTGSTSGSGELSVAGVGEFGVLGGVKIGTGLTINQTSGLLSVSLPIATTETTGVVKIGSGLYIDTNTGLLELNLPTASTFALGGVKVDGTTITINDRGVISAVNTGSSGSTYTLPVAGVEPNGPLGGVIVGSGLSINNNGVLSATQYTLPTASSSVLGGIKIGNGLSIQNGVVSTKEIIGANGIAVTSNASNVIISAQPATSSSLGVVQVDGTTITVDNNGVIKLAGGAGTVRSFSFQNGNGFTGLVATASTTPKLSLSITATGILKGENGSITQAESGIDYQAPLTVTNSGTTGQAKLTGTVLNVPVYQGQISLTTLGNTGTATLINDVLNIPEYGTVRSVGITSSDIDVTGATNPITTTGSFNLTLKTVTISKGGTGSSNKQQAFNNLSPTTEKGDIIYHDGNNNVRLPAGDPGKVLKINPDGIPNWESFSEASVVYVNVFGDNATGDGTIFNPFSSITRALSSYASSAALLESPVIIKVGPGTYNENTISLRKNVFIVGSGQKNTIIKCNTVEIGSTFSTLSEVRSGLKDISITLNPLGVVNLDFLAQGSEQGKLYFENVDFNGTVITNCYSKDNVLNFNTCYIATLEVYGGWYNLFKDCTFLNDVKVYPNNLGYISNSSYVYFYNCYVTGNLIIYLTGTDFFSRLFVFLYGLHLNIITELQINATNGGVYASTESIPVKDKFKNFNNAPFYRLNDAYAIQYFPAEPTYWDTPPTNVNDALDNLAYILTTVGTVKSVDIDPGTTGLTVDGGPITEIGTFTLSGTLAINHGGTGQTSFSSGYIKSDGEILLSSSTVNGSDVDGDISGNAQNINGILDIPHGGTGVTNIEDIRLLVFPDQNTKIGKYLTTDGNIVYWDDVPPPLPSIVDNSGKFLYTDGTNTYWNEVLPSIVDNSGKFLYTDGTNTYWNKVLPDLPEVSDKAKFLITDGSELYWDELGAGFLNGILGGTNGQIQFNNNGLFSGSVRMNYNTRDVLTVGSGTSDEFIIRGKTAINDLYSGSSVYIKAGDSFPADEDTPVPSAGNVYIGAGGGSGLGIPGFIAFTVGKQSTEVFRIKNNGAWALNGNNSNVGQVGYVLTSSGDSVAPNMAVPTWQPLPEASTSVRGIIKLLDERLFNGVLVKSGLELIQNPYTTDVDLVLKASLTGVDGSTLVTDSNGVIKVNIPQILSDIFPSLDEGVGKFLTTDGTQLYWADSLYVLPTATDIVLGGVKVDNNTIKVDVNGTIRADIASLLPPQTNNEGKFLRTVNSELRWDKVPLDIAGIGVEGEVGVVKVDGETILIDATGLITVDKELINDYVIPDQSGNSGKILSTNGTTVQWIEPGETGLVTNVIIDGGETGLIFENIFNADTGLLSSTMTGVLDIPHGGTGSNERAAALNNLLPSQVGQENSILISTGIDAIWGTVAMGGPLPIASTTILGAVKIDGDTIIIDGSGVISSPRYILPVANIGELGGVKIDGITIVIDEQGIISAPEYILPLASEDALGGVKIDGLTIKMDGVGRIYVDDNEVLPPRAGKQDYYLSTDGSAIFWAPNNYVLPTATETVLGGVKVDGITITAVNGVISAPQYTLPVASDTVLGGVKVDGITITAVDGVISATQYILPTASDTVLGGVKVDGTTIKATVDGTISGDILAMLPPLSGDPGKVLATDGTNLFWNTGDYVLEPATPTVLGGVKIDGSTIVINEEGVISASLGSLLPDQENNQGKFLYTDGTDASWQLLPKASQTSLGVVKVDNSTITIDSDGMLTAKNIKITGQNNRLVYINNGMLDVARMEYDGVSKLNLGTSSGIDFELRTINGGDFILSSENNGDVVIRTSADGNPIERLRFKSTGEFSVGQSGTSYGFAGQALVSKGQGSTPEWGVVAVTGGGTGATTPEQAINNLLPSQEFNEGSVLVSDGTDVYWAPPMGDPMPIANLNRIGGVRPDGDTIVIDVDGIITAPRYVLPVATPTTLGGVKIDNQTVVISQDGVISVTGFGLGTVTSVDISGDTTGLVFNGGPITDSGIITLSGVLNIENGGTGGTTPQEARTNILPADQALNIGRYLRTDGTDVYWSDINALQAAGSTGQLQVNLDGLLTGTARITYDGVNTLKVGLPNDGSREDGIFNILGHNNSGTQYPASILVRPGATSLSSSEASSLYLQGSISYGINTTGGNVYIDGGLSTRSDGGSVIIRTTTGPNSPLTERLAIADSGSWYLANNTGQDGQVITSNGPDAPPSWRFVTADGRGLTGDTLAENIIYSSLKTLGILDNLYVSGVTGLGTLTPQSKFVVSSGDDNNGFEIEPTVTGNILKSINRLDNWYSPVTIESSSISFNTVLGSEAVERFKIDENGLIHVNGSYGNVGDVLTSNGSDSGPTWQAISIASLLPSQENNFNKVLTTDGYGNLSWQSASTGTVTSVDVDGSTTGLVFAGGPIIDSGVLTLSGTLNISNGGTGSDSILSGYVVSDGTKLSSVVLISGSDIDGDIAGNAANVNGIVAVENGGTGASDVDGAIANLLPSQQDNSGKVLSTDGQKLIWLDGVGGSVGSVDVSGGTTGLVFTGGPIITTGVITMEGTLSVVNGGTGATTQQEAINNLSGELLENTVLRSDGTNVTLSKINLASDVEGSLPIQNGGTGQSSFAVGYIKSDGTSLISTSTIPGADINGDISGNAENVNGTVAIANGGTGRSSFFAGYIKSNGSALFSSTVISGTDVSGDISGNAGNVTGVVAVANGGTGQSSFVSGYIKSDGAGFISTDKISGQDIDGDIAGTAENVTGIVAVANGGTGQSSFEAGYIRTDGVTITSVSTISGTDVVGNITGNSLNVTGIVEIDHGGTGADNQQTALNNLSGNQTANTVLRSDGTNVLLSKVLLEYDVSGILPIKNGGTGINAASTVELFNQLVPDQTDNSGKYLKTINGEVTWGDLTNVGTVTSIDVSGGTTGLTFSGGPITSNGVITMAGTLSIANGGTGKTSFVSGYIKSDGSSLSSSSTINGSDVTGDISGKASNITGIVAVANGGTGKTSFVSGYIKSDGTNFVSSPTISGADVFGDINGNAINVSGIVAIANGGTGANNQQDAINALVGNQKANRILRSDGTNMSLAQVDLATDVKNILPINNGGTGQSSFTAGYIKSDGTNLVSASTIAGVDVVGDINGNAINVSGIVAIANGGTGANNKDDALKNILPDQTGQEFKYLMSNGVNSYPTWEAPVSSPLIEEIVATEGQTVVNTVLKTVAKSGNVAYLQVFLNGVLQREGATKGYTVTNVNQITFNAALNADDDITIYSFVKG